MVSRAEPGERRGAWPPRAKKESPTDLSAFYEEVYLPLVRRVTWRHGLPTEDARDIVQDAFVLAVQKLDLAGNPRAWLIQVVDHLAINHSRKISRRIRLAERWRTSGHRERSFAEGPE